MNHGAMYGWIKEYDKTRYVQYESASPGSNISDINVPMYPMKSWVEDKMADTEDMRPFIMCEYAYAKSNSNGNFKEFWDLVDKYPRFQGGFIWDFQDKALTITREDGSKKYVYAGAYGETVIDPVPDMCLNGVVFSDMSLKPAAFEIKNCQAPVRITTFVHPYFPGVIYQVKNDYQQLDLSNIRITWELQCDGVVVDSGETKQYFTKAGESERLEYELNPEKVSGEAYVNFKLSLREDTPYAKAGHIISTYQMKLEQSVQKLEAANISGERLSTKENEEKLEIQGENTQIIFDKLNCVFEKVVLEGIDRFVGGRDNFYRAVTGIDEGTHDPGRNYADDWRNIGLQDLKQEVLKVETLVSDSQILIFTEVSYHKENLIVSSQFRIGGKGIEISKTVINNCPTKTIPRIGMTFILPEDKNEIIWYGRGPWENYADRKTAASIGIYSSTVADQYTPYIKPVECGGKEDVRYLLVKDGVGQGIRITGATPFHFDIHDYSIAACDKADYEDELVRDGKVYLNVDYLHAGLGGDTGWMKNIHDEYLIGKGSYHYQLSIGIE
jgi:beta-galactosidase